MNTFLFFNRNISYPIEIFSMKQSDYRHHDYDNDQH